jgi:hypothetical protein
MTPEGDIETNPHAFGEKWRVIDRSIANDLVQVEEQKPFINQCQVDRTKKAEAERLCNTLRTGIFKRILLTAFIILNYNIYFRVRICRGKQNLLRKLPL